MVCRQWKALNEYELRNDALDFITGKRNNGRRVVIERDVYDTLHAGKILRSVGNMELIAIRYGF